MLRMEKSRKVLEIRGHRENLDLTLGSICSIYSHEEIAKELLVVM